MSAVALVEQSQYPVIAMPQGEVAALLADNLGQNNEGVSFSDLVMVKCPTGGGTSFSVFDIESGEDVMVKTLKGFIIYWHPQRAFWIRSMDEAGGESDPDCVSGDGTIGFPNAKYDGEKIDFGGECGRCPKAAFGSNTDGNRQACKSMRKLYMMLPGEMLPIVISIPPTSIKHCRQYFTRLASKNTPYYMVESEVFLTACENSKKIKYSEVKLRLASQLPKGELDENGDYIQSPEEKAMRAFHLAIKPQLERFQTRVDHQVTKDVDA